MSEIDQLKLRIKELEKQCQMITREKIDHMSSEVVDSNPYR